MEVYLARCCRLTHMHSIKIDININMYNFTQLMRTSFFPIDTISRVGTICVNDFLFSIKFLNDKCLTYFKLCQCCDKEFVLCINSLNNKLTILLLQMENWLRINMCMAPSSSRYSAFGAFNIKQCTRKKTTWNELQRIWKISSSSLHFASFLTRSVCTQAHSLSPISSFIHTKQL